LILLILLHAFVCTFTLEVRRVPIVLRVLVLKGLSVRSLMGETTTGIVLSYAGPQVISAQDVPTAGGRDSWTVLAAS
jgi:hypothetical protein